MESPLLRHGVAAAQAALCALPGEVTPKKEEAKVKDEPSTVKREVSGEQFSPFGFSPFVQPFLFEMVWCVLQLQSICVHEVKLESDPSAKKRKTEWQAGLSKLPGDTTLVKDAC